MTTTATTTAAGTLALALASVAEAKDAEAAYAAGREALYRAKAELAAANAAQDAADAAGVDDDAYAIVEAASAAAYAAEAEKRIAAELQGAAYRQAWSASVSASREFFVACVAAAVAAGAPAEVRSFDLRTGGHRHRATHAAWGGVWYTRAWNGQLVAETSRAALGALGAPDPYALGAHIEVGVWRRM
jgi:hypothetical protein